MNLDEALNNLPVTDKKVVAVLSGGLDSSVMTMLLVQKYGADKVKAVSYYYGQKQSVELIMAKNLCDILRVEHKVLDLAVLGEIAQPMCANIAGTDVDMPTIQDVLGDPQPPTYVPFRNMILLSLTMSFAEANDASHVFTGLQVHDEYGYWDTSQRFVDSINAVATQNRTHSVKVVAPFSHLSKETEINLAVEMDHADLLRYTMTCYDPTRDVACGKCPSCSERIMNFAKAKLVDPCKYNINIPWNDLIFRYN
tara:strand:- start:4380 stop:5138 length:759 start_codon:yes stop_codon:yes gene_type:complete